MAYMGSSTVLGLDPPRGPKRPFWSGNATDFAGDSLAFYRECERFSDDGVVRLHLWRHPIYVVTHPDRIEDVLVKKSDCFIKSVLMRCSARALGEGLLTSEGAHWRRQRKTIQPLFHTSRLTTYGEIIAQAIRGLLASFRHGEERNVYADVRALCLESMSRLIFGEEASPACE